MARDRYPLIKHWTPDEAQLLREMLKRGSRPEQIAEVLDRTPKAVRIRANLLGFAFSRVSRRILSRGSEVRSQCGNLQHRGDQHSPKREANVTRSPIYIALLAALLVTCALLTWFGWLVWLMVNPD
ncbi:SANT/Myb-like DNA-binding domain-containing protein [Bradyrhizobium japonicum]|uniref:SANT/Myb-like DNA-binding domain-containing protein n=1 Tax=Bradyrhizobium japonicum TaxID=375 RepID=UPI0032DF2D97